MKCYISSIDPMAMNYGPGIRVLVDLQNKEEITEEDIVLTPNEMVDRIRKLRPFFGPDGGGVTFTGNIEENIDFLVETSKICHKAGITTAFVTNGLLKCDVEKLLKNMDIVLLNIESLPMYNYNDIEIDDLMTISKFVDEASMNDKEIWIKQVINEKNADEKYMLELKKYINRIGNVKNIELISDNISLDVINNLKGIL